MVLSIRPSVSTILLAIVIIAGPTPVLSQQLEHRSFLDGKVTMLVPVGFQPMSEEMLSAKYPSERRPTLVLTNPSGSVNVALNHTRNRVADSEIPQVHRSMEQMFRRVHPTAHWHDSRTGQRGGKQYLALDVVTPAIDTDIRNMIFATSLDGRMLLVSFNCVVELQSTWAPLGRRIIDSITLADG